MLRYTANLEPVCKLISLNSIQYNTPYYDLLIGLEIHF